ncbi:tryptophan halogenase family protein [Marinimicrobium sp. ABcell2]|uniref:tryptophan halogenase family protein n=1 Tax=Marinimicrobium sp. ABcell2 TaxID=3069751 RepID=UPI0027ADE25D|nr:tryptophan halogenase family protein [Marinimicrobium sp. ABcell2]MDQ2076043.1 tryptophan 7-halogenase [Marinimicrobium sp. ABcell2]
MKNRNIRKIVIVGGGTSGWMSAATFARFLSTEYCQVTLVESEDIGTVGVGEASIPQLQVFNRTLKIDEDEFIRQTQGTFKLGIQFVNWGQVGDSYFHGFGDVGRDMESLPFYHFWLKMRQQGKADALEDYSLSSSASIENRFMRSVDAGNSPLSNIAHAFHFDAGLYAKYLRGYSEERGVKRIEGKITDVRLRETDGYIKSVVLASGEEIEGDFFIDCSGFRALLIGEALKVGYVDWSHWLPCDSAWAVPSKKLDPLPSYTRATAHSAGWQWRIPLQHRTGNGHVFSSKFMDDDEARSILLNNLETEALADPRKLNFVTGKREKFWEKNCLAVGLASGFMEPLESTSIHLVQSSLARFMSLFPSADFTDIEVAQFNKQADFEFERIRDFLILHYKATERDDSEFWRYCRDMDIPDSLKEKIELFKLNGQVFRYNSELFNELSWVEVFYGQRIKPAGYHPLVDVLPDDETERRLQHVRSVIKSSVEAMPSHQEFIDSCCKAKPFKM